MVYDEHESEESLLLRKVTGAHTENICLMSYCFHLSLVAIGCINGEISIFDFEMSKLLGILHGHNQSITAMEFMFPYPLLVSAAMDGSVCLWGVRPIPIKYLNICL